MLHRPLVAREETPRGELVTRACKRTLAAMATAGINTAARAMKSPVPAVKVQPQLEGKRLMSDGNTHLASVKTVKHTTVLQYCNTTVLQYYKQGDVS